MRVLGFSGSPRRGGNTDILLHEVLKGAAGKGADIKILYLNDLNIAPCQECGGCDESGECITQDDMQMVYQELRLADVILLASPLFFMGVTAQTKAMIDRCQQFWVRKYVLKEPPLGDKRKRKGLFISTGGRKVPNLFDGALVTVKTFFRVLDVEYVGGLLYSGIDAKGDIARKPEVLREAFLTGQKLVENPTNEPIVPVAKQ